MNQLCFTSILLLSACLSSGFAGQRVQPQNMYVRLVCVVPIVGAGTYENPRRPMYVPKPGAVSTTSGIIAFTQQVSDDGQYALVELVARDRGAFKPILEDRHPQVRVFERGKHKKEDVEREFRKYKKDIDLEKLHVAVP